MHYLVCYDIATGDEGGPRRLARVARFLERYGTRVQYSVFEVHITPQWFRYVRQGLLDMLDLQRDSLRIYTLANDADHPIEHHGAKKPMELFGVIVV